MKQFPYPEVIVTEWQAAFNGGWRVPSTCNGWDSQAYWLSMLRAWDDDKDWNMDETARN